MARISAFATPRPNRLGNLIVGYNELRGPVIGGEDIRTGSHNVVVGPFHNFSRFGGLVAGFLNTISGNFAVVSGGSSNTASLFASVVSGGGGNTASGDFTVVSGGHNITQDTEFGWSAGSEADEVVVGNFRSP